MAFLVFTYDYNLLAELNHRTLNHSFPSTRDSL